MVTKSGQEGQKIKTKLPEGGHPYQKYVDSPLWNTIDQAIEDLVDNKDLKETTDRVYIVGYLCEKISKTV
jgi:hypothetical protein